MAPELFGGAFVLVQFNGESLPVDIGEVGGFRDRGGSGCRQHVSHGVLLLEPDFGIFQLEYVVTNSCTGDLLARIEEFGVYEQDGSTIRFRSPAIAEGEPDSFFDGEKVDETIVVQFFEVSLVFQ